MERLGFGDEMGIDPSTQEPRRKYVHQQGVVTKAKFVPFKKNVNKRGYTGIFKSGAKNMVMRFSDAG